MPRRSKRRSTTPKQRRRRAPSRRSVEQLVRDLVAAFGENRLLTYATAIAFRALVALIPLTLLGLALLGLTGEQRIWNESLAPRIEGRVLLPVYSGIDATAQQVFANDGWFLVAFASALAVWDVSGAVRACMSALNELLGARDRRSTWWRFGLSGVLAVGVIVCIVGAVLVLAGGAAVAGSGGALVRVSAGVGRWLVAAVLLGLAVVLVARFAPWDTRSKTWVGVGSIATVVAWLVTSVLFRLFVTHVADFRSAAGVLAAFLVLTTYLYASSIVFLLGFQLDELLRERA